MQRSVKRNKQDPARRLGRGGKGDHTTFGARHRKLMLYTPLGEDAFSAGDRLTVVDVPTIGPVGIATCFDGDFPEPARALRSRGARVVLHPASYELAAAAWWDVL